jgi:hypothetical protein
LENSLLREENCSGEPSENRESGKLEWNHHIRNLGRKGNYSEEPSANYSGREELCRVGYNEFYFFKENYEYRPFDGCKI